MSEYAHSLQAARGRAEVMAAIQQSETTVPATERVNDYWKQTPFPSCLTTLPVTAEQVRAEIKPMVDFVVHAKAAINAWAERTFPVDSVVSYPCYQKKQAFGRVMSAGLNHHDVLEIVVYGQGYTVRIDPLTQDISPATQADLDAQNLADQEKADREKKRKKR